MAQIKDKETTLKSSNGKAANKGNTKQQSADFLVETLHARREQHNIIKIIKGGKIYI